MSHGGVEMNVKKKVCVHRIMQRAVHLSPNCGIFELCLIIRAFKQGLMEIENETPILSCILWKIFKTLYLTQLFKMRTLSFRDNVTGHMLVFAQL